MKKLTTLFFLLTILFVNNSFAQSAQAAEEEDTLINHAKEHFATLSTLTEAKDYKQAEKCCMDFIKHFETYSPELKKDYTSLKGGVYYNLACYRSMQGKKKSAIEAFAQATELGGASYSNAVSDSDLNNIRNEKRFKELMQSIRETTDYKYVLQKSNGYCNSTPDSVPAFTYMHPNDSNLVRLRQHFNLDSIAGSGDEISKIKNILLWAHNVVRHDGSSNNPASKNAFDLIEVCRKENRGINCRMMATMLNECYLAMGFKSRFVTCMPKVMIDDCHVINTVYSVTLDKWLWVDPTFNAYVTDEEGTMLSIAEVRERLRTDQPLVLNEDANWNNQNKQTKEHYLDYYMAKNLYYMTCMQRSEYNAEGKPWSNRSAYIDIIPEDFKTNDTSSNYKICNERFFWQSPYGE